MMRKTAYRLEIKLDLGNRFDCPKHIAEPLWIIGVSVGTGHFEVPE